MQHPWFVLRFTWLSGAGKTTISDAVFDRMKGMWVWRIEQLDSDLVRSKITKDLGFSKADREENIRRVSFVASLLSHHGVWVLASFISPYQKMRDYVRWESTNFVEVYISTPLSICEKRDVKWLYAKARKGEIMNFTGISDPYEIPKNPDIEINAHFLSIEDAVDQIISYLKNHKYI